MELDILFSHARVFCSEWLVFLQRNRHYLGGVKTVCKKRCLQLLVPYAIWSMISFCISGDYSFHNFSALLLFPDRYFWFLWVLFWICIIFLLSRYLSWKVNVDELWGIAMVSIIMLVIMIAFDLRMFGFQFLSYYFIFYSLGYCIHRFTFMQFSNGSVFVLLAAVWFLLAWSWNMHKLPDWFPDKLPFSASIMHYLYRGITAFVAIILILNAAPTLLNKGNRFNLNISKLGTYSLGIYTCHLCFMGSLYRLMELVFFKYKLSIWVDVIMLFSASLFMTLLIVNALKRNNITSKLLLGK